MKVTVAASTSPTSPPGKTGILLAAFGPSTHIGQRALTEFESRIREVFPGMSVRWAFTSDKMRSRLAEVNKKTDSIQKALMRMWYEKYSRIAIQPLQIIPGSEHTALIKEAVETAEINGFHVAVGSPLVLTDDDVKRTALALTRHIPAERQQNEAVLWVGHGTDHAGGASYHLLAETVRQIDPKVFIGTLEGTTDFDFLLPKFQQCAIQKIWLMPLLSVVGRHAEVDIAGEQQESWRARIEKAGFICTPVIKGTAEYSGFIDIWVDHLTEAVLSLAE